LTQRELADLSGVLRQHISALEHHRLLLTDERARKLAPYLKVHPAALIVGQAASLVWFDADKTSVTLADFRALDRAFGAARAAQNVDPRLRLELIRVVGATSHYMFVVWSGLVDEAEREAELALEVGTR
jgi:transcriptional regulator with XRE-family HTH domain